MGERCTLNSLVTHMTLSKSFSTPQPSLQCRTRVAPGLQIPLSDSGQKCPLLVKGMMQSASFSVGGQSQMQLSNIFPVFWSRIPDQDPFPSSGRGIKLLTKRTYILQKTKIVQIIGIASYNRPNNHQKMLGPIAPTQKILFSISLVVPTSRMTYRRWQCPLVT